MTDRERLIGLLNQTFAEQHEKRGLLTAPNTADYLLANGAIVPPCKVGDMVYTYGANRVKEWKITFCGENSRGEHKMIAADNDFKNMLEFWDYDIGKTVFLTNGEAEKALKERNNAN